jgi:hypothetical protein
MFPNIFGSPGTPKDNETYCELSDSAYHYLFMALSTFISSIKMSISIGDKKRFKIKSAVSLLFNRWLLSVVYQ